MNDSGRIVERLQEVRSHLGLSQRAMADAVGCSARAMAGYETGDNVPGGLILQAIAGLGIDVHWLLTGEGTMVRGAEPTMGDFDEELFIDSMIEFENAMKAARVKKISPKKRARACIAAYKAVMRDRRAMAAWTGPGDPPIDDSIYADMVALAAED